jgi:putative oxidoreductase
MKKLKDYSPIVLRVIFLLYFYTAFKFEVYKPTTVEEFSKQLIALKFPIPLFFAYLGTYSVFISYFLIIIGWKTRWAALPIIVYFAVAILAYHIPEKHTISKTMPATVLLVLGIFFLMNGAGKPSVDEGI